MNIMEKHPIKSLNDIVFADANLKTRLQHVLATKQANPMLLYGEAGTGKSSICKVMAEGLVGLDHLPSINVINVSRISTRAKLIAEIEATTGFGVLNDFGKSIAVLEELDGATADTQKALKLTLEELAPNIHFFATTNCVSGIITPVRDRFEEIHVAPPNARLWLDRAQHVLRAEGIELTDDTCEELLVNHASNLTGRKMMYFLDNFIMQART